MTRQRAALPNQLNERRGRLRETYKMARPSTFPAVPHNDTF